MKHSLVIAFVILVSISTVFSQNIDIRTGFFSVASYSYQGSGYKSIEKNFDELKEIMKLCPECIADLNSFDTKYSIGYVTGFIGGAALGWPIGGYIGSSMAGRPTWEGYYTPMILGGGILFIVTVILEVTAHSDLEHAEELFNSMSDQGSFLNIKKLNYGLSISNDMIGFGIVYRF